MPYGLVEVMLRYIAFPTRFYRYVEKLFIIFHDGSKETI